MTLMPETPKKCQESKCSNNWNAISIKPDGSKFLCHYHWLENYRPQSGLLELVQSF